ncbi:urea ABC transporter permease subunit UrtB [Bacterioplanoides sp. SCSIO 12839]|uniref:urea ABC transporter permease subunit UrtB n=1 Tax=Bacterioplanoides sp. SCSIO 12839 TaxID=2829569 RepID=UPI002107333B|nr:urea ABC transporter permease subunit UrtB [Bacterioplanoides sp. SCSIO 12839]UTW48144.1 urea ABC transporter permease subunit UrtB [Bacterioplanoides sp. SCSIO 12839]
MRVTQSLSIWLLALLLSIAGPLQAQTESIEPTDVSGNNELELLAQQLPSANYKKKANIIEQMSAISDEKTLTLLQAMLDSELYYRKSDKLLVLVESFKSEQGIKQAFGDQPVENIGKRKFKKIGVNNKIRRQLRSAIALIQISSGNDEQRFNAAQNLLKAPDSIASEELRKLIKAEERQKVSEVLLLSQALQNLNSADADIRLQAINALDRSLYSEVRVALSKFADGFSEEQQKSRADEYQLATKTIENIDQLLKLNSYAENLYFGLSLGAVLLLAAIGLAITFGVMGVINMAHGEMIMLGAYTTYVVQQLMPNSIGMSLVVAIPAAFLVSGLVGVLIERSVIRHLYGRPLETLLATFGISLILQQAVRSIFGPLNRDVTTPDWMAGTFMINPALELTFNRLYIIIFSLLVLAALALVLKRTLFGLQMRAVTMNRPMANSMGIRTGWVDALTFGLGSGIAGIAGVALSQLTNVGPNLGQAYIIDSFMVVVFGGVGNLWGTLVAAMSLGVANKFFEPLAGAVLAKILVLVFIILFIQKRPRGLFALKGRAVEG